MNCNVVFYGFIISKCISGVEVLFKSLIKYVFTEVGFFLIQIYLFT